MEAYRELKQIGRGNYGSVYLVQELETGLKFVVKKIRGYTGSARVACTCATVRNGADGPLAYAHLQPFST